VHVSRRFFSSAGSFLSRGRLNGGGGIPFPLIRRAAFFLSSDREIPALTIIDNAKHVSSPKMTLR